MSEAADPSWEEKRFDALLEAAKTAIQRVRYVFVAINIAGVLMISAEFNGALTWLRYPLNRPTTDETTRKLLAEVFRKDLSTVAVPLLGIKFSVYDLGVIGSFAMSILALWFFYCVRRENLVVRAIVREAQATLSEGLDRAKYLYHGVAHYFVFTTATTGDVPGGQQQAKRVARAAVRVLGYLPVWAPALVLISDYLSLFLRHLTATNPERRLADIMSGTEWSEVIARTLFAAIMVLLSLKWCRDSDRFDQDTRTQLHGLRQAVEPGR